MGSPTFLPLDEPVYGESRQISPLIRRVIAENPSQYTYRGTGTYIVGHGDVVVIDPGPDLDSHRDSLVRALEGERVVSVLITHCHADHSPLARWMSEHYDAPTVGFGPHPRPGNDDLDDTPEPDEDDGSVFESRESIDFDFVPDVAADHRDLVVDTEAITMRAVHTPGHTSNHLCFSFEQEHSLFTGDHIMGWSTTVVSPPDGDMVAYLSSLRKVLGLGAAVLLPTHGPPRDDGGRYVRDLIAHREQRDWQILELLAEGPSTIGAIVEVLYADIDSALHRPARRSVWAHLVGLVAYGRAAVEGGGAPHLRSVYRSV